MKNRKFISFIFVAVLAFVLGACVYEDSIPTSLDQVSSDQVAADQPELGSMFISVEQLHALMQQNDPNLVVIGVATGGYSIPGSITFNGYSTFTRTGGPYSVGPGVPNQRWSVEHMSLILSWAGVTSDSHVVVYSNTSPHNGTRLLWDLHVMGLDNAQFLNGGMNGWIEAGLPAVPNSETVVDDSISLSEFTPRNYRQDEIVIGLEGAVYAAQNPDTWLILDVRAPNEFAGEHNPSYNGFYGRIANSVNIQWVDVFAPGSNNTLLRPEAEIREIFAPAFDGRNVLLLCRGNPRATFAWAVLTDLGVNAYIFNGSWHTWAYALDPDNNHPLHETVISLSEAVSHTDPAVIAYLISTGLLSCCAEQLAN